MKKIKPIVYLFLIALLFSGCTSEITNDEDTALINQIQGRWKLTASYSDDQPAAPISNGYVIEFKADKTFVSDEENGYNSGTYTILKSLGTNLRLIYHKSWAAKQVYKYIDSVDADHIYIQASQPEPTLGNPTSLGGYILTRVP